MQFKPYVPYIFFFALLLGIAFALTYNFLDPDFGWHVKTGELILQRGVPYQDWYTHTMPGFAWIDHEWLMDIGMYVAYTFISFRGLQMLFLVFYTASFFIIRKKGWVFWAFALPVFLGYLATVEFLGVRPQLFTVFFIAILLKIMDWFLERNSRAVYVLPLLFLVWVNLHASFFAGLFILGIILGCEIIKKSSWEKIGVLAGVTALSFVATLINPYGIRIYEELFRTVGDNYLKFHIAEWFPLFLSGFKPLVSLYIGVAVACMVLLYKKIRFNQLILSLVFLVLAISSIRYFMIFVIVSLPMLIEAGLYLKELVYPEKIRQAWQSPSLLHKAICLLPLVVALSLVIVYAEQQIGYRLAEGKDFYPGKALAYLEKLPASQNVFNEYGWGGYIIWKLPNRKVFIDGRMPSWRLSAQAGQDEQFLLKEYVDVYTVQPGFESILEKYKVQLALIPPGKLSHALESQGWETLYEDETALILQKP